MDSVRQVQHSIWTRAEVSIWSLFGNSRTVHWETAVEVSQYVTSVVLGNDIVPRLSYRSLCKFRDEILLSIARAKVNKTYIMQAMFRNVRSDDLMCHRGEEPDSEFLHAYQLFRVSF